MQIWVTVSINRKFLSLYKVAGKKVKVDQKKYTNTWPWHFRLKWNAKHCESPQQLPIKLCAKYKKIKMKD
jgi:hypothetical protein